MIDIYEKKTLWFSFTLNQIPISLQTSNIVLSELWLYDNEIIHTCGGIIAPRVPRKLGTCGAIIPPRVWIISLSYNQS